MQRRLIDCNDGNDDNTVVSKIRRELLNLRDSDVEIGSIEKLRDNMRKFKDFMEKTDGLSFGGTDKGFQFDPEEEVEELKNVHKLREVMSRD